MKKWLWNSVLVFMALSLISPALAREGERGSAFWKSEKMVEKLGLTDTQISGLDEVEYQYRKNNIEVKARLDSARLELEHALSGETVSQSEAAGLVDKVADARREQVKLKLEKRIKVRSILSPEQWGKLEKSRSRLARKMKEKRFGKPGHHSGEGRGQERPAPSGEES